MPVIQKQFFSLEELKQIFETSVSKQEVATKLNFTYSNGKVYKKIDSLSFEYNLSMDHFDPFLSKKLSAKYVAIEKQCPVCGNLFETKLNHRDEKTTCSSGCSNVYFAACKHTELSNLKRSLKLRKNFIKCRKAKKSNKDSQDKKKQKKARTKIIKRYEKTCQFCGKQWWTIKKNSRFCSPKCSANNSVKNGTHKGWSSRTKLKPSYAEKYIITLLEDLKISNITREYKISKWFIDFADVDRKLALEIDGKQHNLPERKASDLIKDTYLQSNGWTILRIKWKKITKEFREEIINKINILFGELMNWQNDLTVIINKYEKFLKSGTFNTGDLDFHYALDNAIKSNNLNDACDTCKYVLEHGYSGSTNCDNELKDFLAKYCGSCIN